MYRKILRKKNVRHIYQKCRVSQNNEFFTLKNKPYNNNQDYLIIKIIIII